ncbi:hypothetical protein BHM03_00048814 [Ensete ventricosum]|nr:hypothetical protein BHM03_00048814 [Ensete ventricosum]
MSAHETVPAGQVISGAAFAASMTLDPSRLWFWHRLLLGQIGLGGVEQHRAIAALRNNTRHIVIFHPCDGKQKPCIVVNIAVQLIDYPNKAAMKVQPKQRSRDSGVNRTMAWASGHDVL